MTQISKNAAIITIPKADDVENPSLFLKPKVLQIQKSTSRPFISIPETRSKITQDSYPTNQQVIDFLFTNARGEWPDNAADLNSDAAEWFEHLSPDSIPHRKTIVVFFHGGAHILGSKEMYRFLSYRLAQSSRAAFYVVNYRLAPVNPYPCALIDAVSAVLQTMRNYPESNILVAGDIAGGNLATATILVLRDMKLKNVDGILSFSPFLTYF